MNSVQTICAVGLIALPHVHAANPETVAATAQESRPPNIVLILADDISVEYDKGCVKPLIFKGLMALQAIPRKFEIAPI